MLSFSQSSDLRPSLFDRLHSNQVSGWAFSTHKPRRWNTSLFKSLDKWWAIDRFGLKNWLGKGQHVQSKRICIIESHRSSYEIFFTMELTKYFYIHYQIFTDIPWWRHWNLHPKSEETKVMASYVICPWLCSQKTSERTQLSLSSSFSSLESCCSTTVVY